MNTTTRDIGLAIRDFIEAQDISVFVGEGHEEEFPNAATIDFVDVSDPSNPVVHMDNGQLYVINIFSVGSR